MGALATRIQVTDSDGTVLSGLSSIYVWRAETLTAGTDGTYTYFASRTPPGQFEWQDEEIYTFSSENPMHVKTFANTPHVTFKHRYDEGAELCVARAILALTEAGMNV